LLRIEDIDPARCRPEFEAAILEDLAWLGLDWDGPVRRQSEHLADYQAALDRLRDMGLTYPCLARTGPLTFVDEREGRVEAKPETLGDVVLARRDAPASYHLCVTVDDHLQGVALVTRGVDLFHATHIHRVLQAILDLNVPTYLHHLLLTNAAGERLSKRDGAVAIRALRQAGRSAAEVRALAGFSD
jgi:glutamyl-Q tRNA(Asp) synthetase